MTDARDPAAAAIADLIRAEPLGSQEEVTARLGALGFAVTQATVSRDLDQIGAVKVKRGGALALRPARPARRQRLGGGAAAADPRANGWSSIEAAGKLLVIKTPPGSAHLVASAIDQARLAGNRRHHLAATTPCSSRVRDGVASRHHGPAASANAGPGESLA